MNLTRFIFLSALAIPFLACAAADEDSSASEDALAASCTVKPAPKNRMCPAVYDPVCGCDGKTYGNSCEASGAVSSSTPGACGSKGVCELPNATKGFCPTVYDPVCGCNGRTYSNACAAKLQIASWTPGACENVDAGPGTNVDAGPGTNVDAGPGTNVDAGACKKVSSPKNIACPAVYDPVCGCDGNTYGNACEAGRAVTAWTKGACGADK